MAPSGGRLFDMLLEHGVPERGARIYLAACREGPRTAAELARASAVNRVEAYRHIRQLEAAGLLRSAGQRPLRFQALTPEELISRWIRGATERLRRLESDRDKALSDIQEGFLEVETADPKKFTVIEGSDPISRALVRRIGTTEKEIHAAVPGVALASLVEGGVDRALKEARSRGVRVQLVTEVTLANRTEAKHLGAIAELRHSPRPVTHQAWTLDRRGALVHLSESASRSGRAHARVALWSNSPSFRAVTFDHLRHLWNRGVPATTRLVELETPDAVTIPIGPKGDSEPFDRLREIATLGMRATGITDLGLKAPEMIQMIGHQIGRQVAEEVEGETPEEVARSLVEYYRERAMGRLEITRARPLTLRISGCFACVKQSPEIGRMMCPAVIESALETRLGAHVEVSRPDPSHHATRGCMFTVTTN
ncbi:MAG: hypothetical protein L3J93_01955 [Thermoplasmata archaeon]|nr:hypothetical protein [Thermoplasmata archaeon]